MKKKERDSSFRVIILNQRQLNMMRGTAASFVH